MTRQTVAERKRTLIFINLIITCVASSMLITALTSALPSVTADLNISYASGQWITSGYSLIMGVMMPLTAFLNTRFPTKKLYLTGLGITLAGLLLCAASKSFFLMMLVRGLQAIGNGITASMAQVVILTIYPPQKRGAAMGWYGLSTGAAPAVAPVLAGVMIDVLGWRSIFLFAFAIFAISFVWALFVFENVLETERKHFDTRSFLLSSAALTGITLGIGNLGSHSFGDLRVCLMLSAGFVMTVLFTVRQRRLERPFLDISVFRDKNFSVSVLAGILLYLEMMGLTVLLPLYIQTVCGYSATVSGAIKLPGSLAMAATSLFTGMLLIKLGIRKIVIAGALLMLASNIGFTLIRPDTSLGWILAANTVNNVAIGCLLTPLITWGLQDLSGNLTAHGSAMMNSLRTIAGSIGSAIFVSVMMSHPADPAHGFSTACRFMAFISTLLLITGFVCLRNNGKQTGPIG